MNEKISVIVPVYNVEAFLPQCVESIQTQTYHNLEIILVDDGSPDNCPAMCDAYAAKDRRIKVIHKKNGGQAEARNRALDIATGEYITFVDSDDYILPDYLETLYTALRHADADIAVAEFDYYFDGDEKKEYSDPKEISCVFSQKEALQHQLCNRYITAAVWAKIYKAHIFREIRFPVGEIYEDLAIIFDLVLKTKKIAYTNQRGYRYRIRPCSTMQREFDMRQYVEVRWIERAMAMVEEKYPELEQEIRGRRVWSYFKTLYRILCSKNRAEYQVQQDEMVKKIRRDSKGLLKSNRIGRNLKIKIASLYLGRYGYYCVQKVSDILKWMRAGKRYVV